MLSLSVPLRFLPRNIYVFDYRVLSRPLDLLAMLFNVQNIDCFMGFFNFEKKKSDSKIHLALRNCPLVLR